MMVEESYREINRRNKALFNMCLIILTIFIVDTYATLYSIILMIWANEDCYV